MAKVVSSTNTLSLLSSSSEQAIDLWVINDVVYYSAFNTTSGKYLLRVYDGTTVTTMVENVEVYNLSASGKETALYFDGLDFSKNSYKFGTIGTVSPYTVAAKSGLTGTLKTLVVLP